MNWNEVAARIAAMPEERRNDPAECMPPTESDAPVGLQLVADFDTVRSLWHDDQDDPQRILRSSVDNAHRPDRYVIMLEENSFAEDGTMCYELTDAGEFVPLPDGKGVPCGTIINDGKEAAPAT